MQLQTLISNSNNFIYIDRLDDIFKIAAAIKGNIFFMDPSSQKLFGSYAEPYSIIETQLPFPVKTPFLFTDRLYQSVKSKNTLNQYKTFFYIPEFPQFLFPEYMRASVMNGTIGIDWEQYILVDYSTGLELPDYLVSTMPDDDFAIKAFTSTLNNYHGAIANNIYIPIAEFTGMEKDPVIVNVTTSKVSQGRKIIALETIDGLYAFYVFKALVGPLTRQDKLSLYMHKDRFVPKRFMATFRVTKKSKLAIPELPVLVVDTHISMINLA